MNNPVIMIPSPNLKPVIDIDTTYIGDSANDSASNIDKIKPKPKREDGIELLISDDTETETKKEDGPTGDEGEKKTISFS